MEATTTVKPAASMKSAPSVEARASPEVAADWPASSYAASNEAAPGETRSRDHASPASNKGPESWPPDEPASNERPKSRAADERMPVKPRPRADKDPANKPAWPIVAIWRTGVRVVSIVAVGANRSRTHVSRHADTHADRDSLRLRERCATQANTKHRENSDVSHFRILSESPRTLPDESR